MSEFEKAWLMTRLARKAAAILSIGLLLLTTGWTTSALLLLVHTKLHAFLPEQIGILPLAHWLPLACLAVAAVLGLAAVYSFPAKMDRALGVRTSAAPDDPAGKGKLDLIQAEEINHNLRQLQGYADAWWDEGLVDRRATVLWSPVLEQNACTYGGLGDTIRVVFAADLLLSDVGVWEHEEFATEWAFTLGDRAAILAHELGHVHFKDFVVAVFVDQLMRILRIIYFPLSLLDKIAAIVTRIVGAIPLLGWALRLAAWICLRLPLFCAMALFRISQVADQLQSQLREYVADTFSVKLMGDADPLLTAMMKLGDFQLAATRVTKSKRRAKRWDRFSTAVALSAGVQPDGPVAAMVQFFQNLGSTHPPMLSRLERLAKLGFAIDQESERRKRGDGARRKGKDAASP